MFVPFETLPSHSRVWIFQAHRPFTAEELKIVHERLRAFTEEWSVHGSPLPGSYAIPFDQFIVLGADESRESASGCSIDSSVRVIKALEEAFGIRLFERNQVAFKIGERIVLVPMQELKEKFGEGILNEDTLTFNNLVDNRAAFEQRWLVTVGETWLKRYLSNPLVKVK